METILNMFSPFGRSASKQKSNRTAATDEKPADDDGNDNDLIEDFEIPADANPPEVPEFAGDGWKTMIENGEADAYIAGIVAKYMPVDESSPSMSAAAGKKSGGRVKRARAADTPTANGNKKTKTTPKRKTPARKTGDDDDNDGNDDNGDHDVDVFKLTDDNGNEDKRDAAADNASDAAVSGRFDDRSAMIRICGSEALADALADNGISRLTQLETLTSDYVTQLVRDAGFNDEADSGVAAVWPQMAEALLADESWETVSAMRPSVARKAGRPKRNSTSTAGTASKASSPASVESRRPRSQRKAAVTPRTRAAASATPKSRRRPVK